MEEKTEIMQLPAVYLRGEVVACEPEWKNLDFPKLQVLANALGGKLGYVKVRAVYEPVDSHLCSHYQCYRPAQTNSDECGDHG